LFQAIGGAELFGLLRGGLGGGLAFGFIAVFLARHFHLVQLAGIGLPGGAAAAAVA